MRNKSIPTICAASVLLLPVLRAQTMGLPASYRLVSSGFGTALDAGGDRDGFRTVGVTGIIALGHVNADSARLPLFNVSATAAMLQAQGGSAGGKALGAQVSLLGSFAIGVDRSRFGGVSRTYVPLAAALPLLACADGKTIFALYGVPVWNFERVDTLSTHVWRHSWGSGSIGAFFELRSGLGVQAGVGGLFHRTTSDPYQRVVFGLGAHLSRHGVLASAPTSHQGCAAGL
jgi:hypothetical protein